MAHKCLKWPILHRFGDQSSGIVSSEKRKKADDFASEVLIPSRYNPAIQQFRSKAEIIHLAKELDISPGIVAGRYQFLTRNWSHFKDLIRKLEWAF